MNCLVHRLKFLIWKEKQQMKEVCLFHHNNRSDEFRYKRTCDPSWRQKYQSNAGIIFHIITVSDNQATNNAFSVRLRC